MKIPHSLFLFVLLFTPCRIGAEEYARSLRPLSTIEDAGFIGADSAAGKENATSAESEATRIGSERITLDCGGGVILELVKIPAGTFLMGSPSEGFEADIVRFLKDLYREEAWGEYDETRHRVSIDKPFYMGVHEVTQAQYWSVMGDNPSKFNGADLPVEQVSWYDVNEFCRRLFVKTGRKVRLPTEAEWEYACRAGMMTPFNTGETISTDQANYAGNYTYYDDDRKGVTRGKTTPVGSFLPNAWGLYDMHGNVIEWCSDWYGNYDTRNAIDPRGPGFGAYRVVRGGSWSGTPRLCRSANRVRLEPGYRFGNLGFRLALD